MSRTSTFSQHPLHAYPTRKDDYAFFLVPVDLEKVPGYMDVIKQPMDFGTMASKVSRSKYRSLDEFAVDPFSFPFLRVLNFVYS